MFLDSNSFLNQREILNKFFSSILVSRIVFKEKGIEIMSDFLKEAGSPEVMDYEDNLSIYTDGNLIYIST